MKNLSNCSLANDSRISSVDTIAKDSKPNYGWDGSRTSHHLNSGLKKIDSTVLGKIHELTT